MRIVPAAVGLEAVKWSLRMMQGGDGVSKIRGWRSVVTQDAPSAALVIVGEELSSVIKYKVVWPGQADPGRARGKNGADTPGSPATTLYLCTARSDCG